MGRPVAVTLAVVLLAVGCATPAEPTATRPSPSPLPLSLPTRTDTATASPPASATATATTGPSPTAAPTPSPTAPPTATPVPTPPTAAMFWTLAADGLRLRGRLRIRVIGAAPGELRYQPAASATVVDGAVAFVCVDGRAYDGQSGFVEVPGTWSCGSDALVRGFRLGGQPIDAWSPDLPGDSGIRETVELLGDGTWRWDYRATNPHVGGEVRTSVVLDPDSGEIRSASRRDPLGQTTYGISYSEAFPDIAVP